MKKINLIAIMLLFSIVSAFAEGKITVRTEPAVATIGETIDVIVEMSCAEEEVRGVQCEFTLPSHLQVVGIPSYNEDRFDGFVPTLNIVNDGPSIVTFMSFSGDYVTETSGEIFRFTLRVNDDVPFGNSFRMDTEVSYDSGIEPTQNWVYVPINIESPYVVAVSQPSVKVGNEPATVGIALENLDVPAAGLAFTVELPEGLEFVLNKAGKKVDWKYTSRVSNAKQASEVLEGNVVKYMVIDVLTSDNGLIGVGDGEVITFQVQKTGTVAPDANIVIKDISVATVNGREYPQAGEILVAVEANSIQGDVDNDGYVTFNDLTTLVNVLQNSSADTTGLNPDVDQDGKVTFNDLTTLVNILK